MQCTNQVTHTIQAGDTLYSLANRYRTTVNVILGLNPGTDIYNLQIGSTLVICPGMTMLPPTTAVPPIGTLPPTTAVPPIGTLPPTTAVPPIGTLPPTTAVPPIGTLPPTTAVPPTGTVPPLEAIRELLLMILRWINEYFGARQAQNIINQLIDSLPSGTANGNGTSNGSSNNASPRMQNNNFYSPMRR